MARLRRFIKAHRLLSYNLVVIAVILAVQSELFPMVLDGIVGVHWSDEIVRVLRLNTQGFIILLVIQLYLEGSRKDRLEEYLIRRAESADARIAAMLDEASAEQLMAYALRKRFGGASNTGNLVSTLLPNRPQFTETSVSFVTKEIPERDTEYELFYGLDFTARIDEVLFAVAADSLVQEALFASIPELTEVTPLQPGESLDEAATIIRQTISVRTSRVNADGSTSLRPVSLVPIDRTEALRFLPSDSSLTGTEFALFRGRLDGQSQADRRVLLRMHRTMQVGQNCLPWISDRAIFLRSILYDFSSFPGRRAFDFVLYPFFLVNRDAHEIAAEAERTGRFQFDVNNWITLGQGLLVSWQPKSAATAPAPAGPQLAGPQPAGPQPAGPQPAGPQPAGPQPAGPQPADPRPRAADRGRPDAGRVNVRTVG